MTRCTYEHVAFERPDGYGAQGDGQCWVVVDTAEFNMEGTAKLYCAFHAPIDAESIDSSKMPLTDRGERQAGILHHLLKNWKESNRSKRKSTVFRLPGAQVGNIALNGSEFTGGIDFQGATFTAGANFSKAKIPGEANFEGVTFTETADFGEATFREANFSKAIFKSEARFLGAIFTGEANFERATFTETADFGMATFREARFDGATFTMEAGFSKANFTRLAYFEEVTFTESAYFEEVTFTEHADFGGATFAERLDFQRAIFKSEAGFERAIFKKEVTFQGATFNGEAHFHGRATFNGEAIFQGATFTGEAIFQGATFTKEANFQRATFTGEADFCRATFKRSANFKGAAFTDDAIFQQATFTEPAVFYGATFKKLVDFSAATFTDNADFRGATFTEGAYFDGATVTGGANFQGATLKGHFSFRRSTICYISLGNMNLKNPITFDDCTIGTLTYSVHTGERLSFNHCSIAEEGEGWNFRLQDCSRLRFVNQDMSSASFLGADLNGTRFESCRWIYPGNTSYSQVSDHNSVFEDNDLDQLELLRSLYQQLKKILESDHDYLHAGEFHYWEMEIRRRKNKITGGNWLDRILLGLYSFVGDYGESYPKLFRSIVGSLVLSIFGVTAIEGLWNKQAPAIGCIFHDFYCRGLAKLPQFAETVFFGLIPSGVQRTVFDDLNALTAISRGLIVVEWLVLLALATLFVMAIRRQFRR